MDFSITQFPETGSTNDDAKAAAERGDPEGTVIWALRQTAGRGRQGRAWSSKDGNLFCSTILRPPGGPQVYGKYSFVAALAVGDAIWMSLPKATIELKWPNDVLVNGKKISGILLEAGEDWLVTGVGINVWHAPDHSLYPTTCLAAESETPPPELEVVLDNFLVALGRWCETLRADGFEPIRRAWLSNARKGHMRVRLPDSEFEGEFLDLDVDGGLKLRLADGSERVFNAGDVFFSP